VSLLIFEFIQTNYVFRFHDFL